MFHLSEANSGALPRAAHSSRTHGRMAGMPGGIVAGQETLLKPVLPILALRECEKRAIALAFRRKRLRA
jgi:hypothetical protein